MTRLNTLRHLSGNHNMREALQQASALEKMIREMKDCPLGGVFIAHLEDGDHTFHKIGKVSVEMVALQKSFLSSEEE